MLEKIKEVREKLEVEKSNSKRLLLSSLYSSLYLGLSKEEQECERKYMEKMDFILSEEDCYDFLKNDNEIFKDFFEKCDRKYLINDYCCYFLFPENKLKLEEAKDIIYQVLDSINVDKLKSYDKLYCFDKINYKDLERYDGVCCNTFDFFDPIVSMDNKIDKQVNFICTAVHELGHAYENIRLKINN